jgi:tetratricopeptide (TPR) repeat protein
LANLGNALQGLERYKEAIASYNPALITLNEDDFPESYLEVLQDYIKPLLGLGQIVEATTSRSIKN